MIKKNNKLFILTKNEKRIGGSIHKVRILGWIKRKKVLKNCIHDWSWYKC
jgi:hypothetical protein